MRRLARFGPLPACLALACSAAFAQPAVPRPPQAAASAAAAASAPRATTGLTRTVIEDDAVRIEETRLRGAPQRIVVRSKVPGGKDYEILVPSPGKDPSQDAGAAGKRAWSIFSF